LGTLPSVLSGGKKPEARKPDAPILVATHLQKYFPVKLGGLFAKHGLLKAVQDVDLEVHRGETVGLVGESGCGKTVLGQLILGLEKPTNGSVFYEGIDISRMRRKQQKKLRKDVSVVFQDPYASLNGTKTVRDVLTVPLRVHGIRKKAARESRILQLIEDVELSATDLDKYPHEFSGGQRQRICIARALAMHPKVVICDEITSALDVSVKSQILNLLLRLQTSHNLTYLFISHDLNVVEYISDRIMVMYLGSIVEIMDVEQLAGDNKHPYTSALLDANPVADPKQRNRRKLILGGEVPSPLNPPQGCKFWPRCNRRMDRCSESVPDLLEVEPGHKTRCFLYHE
jgi:oligopeptide/dipeptide ABC transporter ATP-binding protein